MHSTEIADRAHPPAALLAAMGTTELPRAEDLSDLLAHWEVAVPVAVEPLSARGHVAKLAFRSQSPLVLKDTGVSAERANWNYRFHARVLAHVHARGVGVPLPVRARSGEPFVDWRDHRYTLSRFQEKGRRPADPDERRLLYRNVGAAISGLYQALATYPDEEVERETQIEDISARSLTWTAELVSKLPHEHRAALVAATEHLMPRVHDALRELPRQLIHRDLHPANMLTAGTAAVGFLDCDHLCRGPRLLDVAYYALGLLKWSRTHDDEINHWPDYLRALVDGYDTASPITDHERAAVPHLVVAVEIRMAVWLFDLYPATIAREVDTLAWLRDHLHEITAGTSEAT